MPLTVLSDSDVNTLLHDLTREDILDLQQSLADALHYYSTSTESDHNGCCSSYQPLRTALKRNDGQTTLFMPASSNDGLGVKIVTLSDSDNSSETSKSDTASVTSSLDSLSLSQQSQPQSQSSSSSTTAIDTAPASLSSANTTTPKGTLTLLSKTGHPRALINAKELTPFRTALASTMLFKKRHNVHDVLVFGSGRQAYWHIRLALLLRGPEIHHLNIINRSFSTAQTLIESLYKTPTNDYPSLSRPKIQILTPQAQEYERLLKSTLRSSSAIFCTTPSLTPLFPATHLTSTEGRKKGRYIAAIGSYKPHMLELHPDILRQAVAPEHGHHHFHKHAKRGGAIVVDSVDACLREAGEIVQAGLKGSEVVEIGELIMLRRDAEVRRKQFKNFDGEGEGYDDSGVEIGEAKKSKVKKVKVKGNKGKSEEEDDDDKEELKKAEAAEKGLLEWLQKGNVIFKSVGLGLMDVVVGMELVRLADERGVGTRIENF